MKNVIVKVSLFYDEILTEKSYYSIVRSFIRVLGGAFIRGTIVRSFHRKFVQSLTPSGAFG